MNNKIFDLFFIGLIFIAVVVYFFKRKDQIIRQKLRDQLEDIFHSYSQKS